MTRSNLPPQAYTRETLASAYEWLSQQPPSIHELATSADRLVGLYLQAKRRNHDSFQTAEDSAPVSSKEFKSQLKDLARVAESFIEPPLDSTQNEAPPTASPSSSNPPRPTSPISSPADPLSKPTAPLTPPQATTAHQPKTSTTNKRFTSPSSPVSTVPPEASSTSHTPTESFDPQTQKVLNHVRDQLNLSTDHEALRMLVSLGYQQIRDILPKSNKI